MVKQANNLYPMSPDEDLKKEGAEPRFSHPTKMRRTNIVRPVGSSVRLKCKAVGNPCPQLRWLKDESEFRQETEKEKKKEIWTLKLNNLQKEDTGKYMCIVTNRLGKLNYTYHLDIIEKIKSKPVLLSPHPQNTTVEYGETASFQCRVKSEVQPHIQWLKRVDDPSMLINVNTTIDIKGQKFMVLKTGDVWNAPDGFYLNKLIIPRATSRDSGMYICLGATSMGYDFRSAFLMVRSDEATGMVKQANNLYPMSPDEDLKKEGAEPRFSHPTKMRRTNIVRPVGSSVRLKCKAVGNPRPQLRWLKDESEFRQETEKEKKKEIWTLKLNNLQKEDTGKYMCIVSNRLGKLNYTYHLDIIEKIKSMPVLLAPHPQNTTVEYGETASFQCRVKSEVQPHIQWLKRMDDPSMLINVNTTIDIKGQKFMVLKTGDVWNAPDGFYLNKLIIPRATSRDSGMYICLGATSMGYDFRSAFLTVRSDPVYSRSNQDDATISSNDLGRVVPILVGAVIIVHVEKSPSTEPTHSVRLLKGD